MPSSPASSPPPAVDHEAERRRREVEEAAERQRQAAEAEHQRQAAEAKRREEQAAFERDRDRAARQLRGGATGAAGLRGSPESGLRGSGASTAARADLSVSPAEQQAWRQLNCAAFIMRHALTNAMHLGDFADLAALTRSAGRVLDGATPDVQCAPAPPFPSVAGTPADMARVEAYQRRLVDRAQAVGTRMAEREAALPEPARRALRESRAASPAVNPQETEIERLRRVQSALNRINEVRLDGRTLEEIQRLERDRQQMGRLLLAAEKIEKGQVDLSISLDEAPAPAAPRHGQSAARAAPPAPGTAR